MNLGVLVTRPPRLLEAPALDGQQDDDDGGEEADDDGRHPNGNEVLLLEPVLHHVLRRPGRDRHHHVQGEVGHGPARPVLGDALEGPVIVQVGSQQDQLALDASEGTSTEFDSSQASSKEGEMNVSVADKTIELGRAEYLPDVPSSRERTWSRSRSTGPRHAGPRRETNFW